MLISCRLPWGVVAGRASWSTVGCNFLVILMNINGEFLLRNIISLLSFCICDVRVVNGLTSLSVTSVFCGAWVKFEWIIV